VQITTVPSISWPLANYDPTRGQSSSVQIGRLALRYPYTRNGNVFESWKCVRSCGSGNDPRSTLSSLRLTRKPLQRASNVLPSRASQVVPIRRELRWKEGRIHARLRRELLDLAPPKPSLCLGLGEQFFVCVCAPSDPQRSSGKPSIGER
jgi:hypothetical protein